MLKQLRIEQFVIIDKLVIDFKEGLTVLTGETGAGKSILLGAVGLMLGDPPNPEAVRQEAEKSVIEALFDPPQTSQVWDYLSERGIARREDKQFVVRRTVTRDGSSDEILVAGRPVDLEFLQTLGELLGEIHGQFANQSLLRPENQLNLLDLSGDFPPELLGNVASALRDVRRYTQELDDENLFLARHAHELKKVDELVTRFDKLGMRKNFLEDCRAEYTRLLIAKETSETFQSILAQLIAGNGALKALHAANDILGRAKNMDREKMVDLTRLLSDALDNTRKAVDEMERISPEYDIDTKPLYHFEEVLKELEEIAREAKIEPEELFEYYDASCKKLHRIRNGREKIAELNDLLINAKNAYRRHCHILSDARMIAGKALSEAITSELPPLKLMRAEFRVLVEEKTDIPWTEKGLNVVTFMARLNAGMPFTPISETASGGEMARLVLALKVVLQRVQIIPTLVFDEVDTGIGGAAAAAVGERLAKLADATQVFVITHSPQVASRGDKHLHVSKRMSENTTLSVVNTLTFDERIDEISRMLAGEVITSEANAAARSLIREAQEAAEVRQKEAQEAKARTFAKKTQTASSAGNDALSDEPAEKAQVDLPTTEACAETTDAVEKESAQQ